VVLGLERRFKGGRRAVDGSGLEVAAGEASGFLGLDGAAKTTTVRMLVTLLRPTRVTRASPATTSRRNPRRRAAASASRRRRRRSIRR
jgi:ABC-type multidrug transport system ATPase subunit